MWQKCLWGLLLGVLLAGCGGQSDTGTTVIAAPTTAVQTRGDLTYAAPINDTLPARTVHTRQLVTSPGDEVQVNLITSGWIAWLDITGPEMIASQSAAAEIGFVASGGTYTVGVGSWYGGGDYTLQARLLNPPTCTATLAPTATFTPTPTATVLPSITPQPTATSTEVLLGTGDVQITLRWHNRVDLDLYVIDPSGYEIYFGDRFSPTGGQLDVDANYLCTGATNNPVENVFWPEGGSPDGTYQVRVNYYPACDEGPTAYEVTVVVEGRDTQTFTGTLNSPNETAYVTTFTK